MPLGEWVLRRPACDAVRLAGQHQGRGQPVAGAVPRSATWSRRCIGRAGRIRACRRVGSNWRSPKPCCCRTSEATLATLHELRELGVRISHGRFRHRLFVAELPAQLPVRQDQDRPIVRPRPARQRRIDCHRACGDRPERKPRHDDDGRGRRDARSRLRHLTREACTEVQGYLFSEPLRADDIPQLLERLGTSQDAPLPLADW